MIEFYSKLSLILTQGMEVSIYDLEDLCDLDKGDHLGNLKKIAEIIDQNGLEISPSIYVGNFDDRRNLRAKKYGLKVEELISQGEGPQLEFKSTAFFDLNKWAVNSTLPIKEYKSKNVIRSLLKTVAAFINTDGGIILVGVEDSGEVLGIEKDFPVLDGSSTDRWELEMRNQISSCFYNHKLVNSFVKTSFDIINGNTIAVLNVTKLRELCFYREGSLAMLFIRQGNRTVSIDYHEISNFFSIERKY